MRIFVNKQDSVVSNIFVNDEDTIVQNEIGFLLNGEQVYGSASSTHDIITLPSLDTAPADITSYKYKYINGEFIQNEEYADPQPTNRNTPKGRGSK